MNADKTADPEDTFASSPTSHIPHQQSFRKPCVRWRDGERVHHPLRWRHGSTEKIGLVCAPGKPLREFGAGPVLVELVPAVGQGEGPAANSRNTGIGEQRRGNLAAASSPGRALCVSVPPAQRVVDLSVDR